MSFSPNPFVDRAPWSIIGFGGVTLTKIALTKIDGVEVKHKWTEQKSKEKSGSTNVFGGTTWGHPKLTFEGSTKEDFDELVALWEMLKPVPGQGGTGSTGTPPPTLALGSPAGKGGTAPAPSSSTTTVPDPAAAPDKAASNSSTPNPGPRPPTISVQYPLLARVEIFACALENWKEIGLNAELGYEVELTIIPDKPPTPAGAGAMAPPAPGSQFAATGGGAAPGDAAQKGAAAGAGGV